MEHSRCIQMNMRKLSRLAHEWAFWAWLVAVSRSYKVLFLRKISIGMIEFDQNVCSALHMNGDAAKMK